MMTAKIVVHGQDREFVRRLAMMIRQAGYVAFESTVLFELFPALERTCPDLLVFDYQDAAALLKSASPLSTTRQPRHGQKPALLALVLPAERDEAIDRYGQRGVHILSKPILHADLIAKIDAILTL
jgi:DNA-binding response OmpR family regulator